MIRLPVGAPVRDRVSLPEVGQPCTEMPSRCPSSADVPPTLRWSAPACHLGRQILLLAAERGLECRDCGRRRTLHQSQHTLTWWKDHGGREHDRILRGSSQAWGGSRRVRIAEPNAWLTNFFAPMPIDSPPSEKGPTPRSSPPTASLRKNRSRVHVDGSRATFYGRARASGRRHAKLHARPLVAWNPSSRSTRSESDAPLTFVQHGSHAIPRSAASSAILPANVVRSLSAAPSLWSRSNITSRATPRIASPPVTR